VGKGTSKTLRNEVTVPNQTSSLEKVRDFVIGVLGDTTLGERSARLLVLAIDEAVTSSILFSVETGREGSCRVNLETNDVCIRVTIEDTGRDLDADRVAPAILDDAISKARKHEMGIFLIRQIVDELSYDYKKGFQNRLTLVKFLP
jgi:anti-sigma regulatory factor (Ser/Thr protein kinase)